MGVAASKQEAFWEACGFGHVDRVKKFLSDGEIDVNWVSYTHDCCPIHVASQGKPEIVQMLIDAKCDVNVKDIRGNLPIHHAAMKGHSDIIQTLITAKSELDAQDKNGWTPLHCAAYWGHLEAVKVLLDNSANVHLQNKDQRTALHETARSQETKQVDLGQIADLLIKSGCDINAKSSDLGEADFTGLMFAAYHDHPEVAMAFIEAGCDIESCGTNWWTALHWAADRGNDEMVYILLDAGANPTKKGWRGETPGDRAQSQQMKEDLMNAANMYRELEALDVKTHAQGSPGKSTLLKNTGSENADLHNEEIIATVKEKKASEEITEIKDSSQENKESDQISKTLKDNLNIQNSKTQEDSVIEKEVNFQSANTDGLLEFKTESGVIVNSSSELELGDRSAQLGDEKSLKNVTGADSIRTDSVQSTSDSDKDGDIEGFKDSKAAITFSKDNPVSEEKVENVEYKP